MQQDKENKRKLSKKAGKQINEKKKGNLRI